MDLKNLTILKNPKIQFFRKRDYAKEVIKEIIDKKVKKLSKIQLKKQQKIIITSSDGINVKYPSYEYYDIIN